MPYIKSPYREMGVNAQMFHSEKNKRNKKFSLFRIKRGESLDKARRAKV